MKRILALTAVLLLGLCGCQAEAGNIDAAAFSDIMAEAAAPLAPDGEPAAVQWDGEYSDGARRFTLSLDADGTLRYEASDGGSGCAAEVTGTSAKADGLHFSLCEDTLSVFGGSYTGNYERE